MSDSVQHDQFPYWSFFYQKFNQERGEILRKKNLDHHQRGMSEGCGREFIYLVYATTNTPNNPPNHTAWKWKKVRSDHRDILIRALIPETFTRIDWGIWALNIVKNDDRETRHASSPPPPTQTSTLEMTPPRHTYTYMHSKSKNFVIFLNQVCQVDMLSVMLIPSWPSARWSGQRMRFGPVHSSFFDFWLESSWSQLIRWV